MNLVGLEGLEPSTKGFTLPRTLSYCLRKIKNPKSFSFCPSDGDRNRAYPELDYGKGGREGSLGMVQSEAFRVGAVWLSVM